MMIKRIGSYERNGKIRLEKVKLNYLYRNSKNPAVS
jgi:hypothetical protein